MFLSNNEINYKYLNTSSLGTFLFYHMSSLPIKNGILLVRLKCSLGFLLEISEKINVFETKKNTNKSLISFKTSPTRQIDRNFKKKFKIWQIRNDYNNAITRLKKKPFFDLFTPRSFNNKMFQMRENKQ